MFTTVLFIFVAAILANAASVPSKRSIYDNGLAAQQLNVKFTTLKITDDCTPGEIACINNGFAQCVRSGWQVSSCPGSLICAALPLVDGQDGTVRTISPYCFCYISILTKTRS